MQKLSIKRTNKKKKHLWEMPTLKKQCVRKVISKDEPSEKKVENDEREVGFSSRRNFLGKFVKFFFIVS